MTQWEEGEFNKFGCVSRCIIKVCELLGQPISKEEYLKRFGHLFINPKSGFGLIDGSGFVTIITALSLMKCPRPFSYDYEHISIEHNQNNRKVLIFSETNLNRGATDCISHCSLLHEINPSEFTLWTPSQNGTEGLLPPFSKADWGRKKCSGSVLG